MIFTPDEIQKMDRIAEHLRIWFQDHTEDKYYPSDTVPLRLRNGISLKLELQVHFDEVLTWLRVNEHNDIARPLEQERDSFLSELQSVEQAIERGDNPPLELIELRSKMTGLIGTLEHTAKVFTDNLTPEKPAETELGAVSREKWYQNRTIQAALIGAVALLFVSIVGWFILYNQSPSDSGQSTKMLTESKEMKKRLQKVEEIAAPPTLSLMPGTITKNVSDHTRLLWFKTSKNEPLGRITFVAKVLDGSIAKIVEFYPEGPTTLETKEISEDGKEARLAYSLRGFYYPRVVLKTSDACSVLVSGSHIPIPITVKVE